MTNKYLAVLTQVVRHPRHSVHETETVSIEVAKGQDAPDTNAPLEIVDFSRGGFRLIWGNPLQKSESIALRFTDHSSGLSLDLPGIVRWARCIDGDLYEGGVQFDDEIDYEQLGALFIAGFLSTDEADSTQ